MHKILKTFPYSPDGVRVVSLAEGSEHDIRADLVEGLKAAGLISELEGAPAPTLPAEGDAADAGTFDPSTADLDAVRTFLKERGVKIDGRTGEAKLRELAAETLKG